VDYRDELRLLSQQQTLLHHLESLPQPRTLTPIFRDTTPAPGSMAPWAPAFAGVTKFFGMICQNCTTRA